MKDRLIKDLLFCLKESHEDEIRNNHYGDGPEGCSYCRVIAEAEESNG